MEQRTCAGCPEPLPWGVRERNPRKWCSGSCRVRTYKKNNPESLARRDARRAQQVKSQAAVRKAKRSARSCLVCGQTFVPVRSDRIFCSPACKGRHDVRARRARRSSAVRIPYTRIGIAVRDGWVCGICLAVVPENAKYPDPLYGSIDHVLPLSLGGADAPENVQIAHLQCNMLKGNRIA